MSQKEDHEKQRKEVKEAILKAYVKLVEDKKMWPNSGQMANAGFNQDRVRRAFGSREELKKIVKRHYPESCKNIVDESVFSKKVFDELKKDTKEYKRFVITSVVVGCEVDQDALESLDTYCKKNDALLLIMTCADPAASVGWDFDSCLKDRYFVGRNLALNQTLWLSTIKLSAKHIDPITSLGRLGQRNGNFIFASPKQRLKMVPTSNKKPPVALMTTGCLTLPNYTTTRYMSDRTAVIADNDHVMGAIIVEIESTKHFHFRQIQFDNNGAFVDLGKFYNGTEVTNMSPEAMVLGDYHSGETDPVVDKCWKADIKKLKPKKVFMHDLFNGLSINHHDRKKKITQARRSKLNLLDLRSEIKRVAQDLNSYTSLVDEVIVVKSNHDEFLNRWLEEFEFRYDPLNLRYALDLAIYMEEELDPLQTAVERAGLKDPNKVKWLQRQEDYKIAGIECGNHGDKGANGARGSLQAMENAYGNSVSGHTHVDEIYRGCYQVGTSSITDPEYAEDGLSSWTQSRCDIYKNGMRQLIRVIGGKTHL
jgi:hypothetical protein